MWFANGDESAADAPAAEPVLSERMCVESRELRNFLSRSRLAVDDSLARRLNSVSSHADCDAHFRTVVVPLWHARLRILAYCGGYAEAVKAASALPDVPADSESAGTLEGPPLDPYAQRRKRLPPAAVARADAIAQWVATEQSVESILRQEDQQILNDKCYYLEWLSRFKDASGSH